MHINFVLNINFSFDYRYKCKMFGLFGRKRALVLGLVLASLSCIIVSAVPHIQGNIGKCTQTNGGNCYLHFPPSGQI